MKRMKEIETRLKRSEPRKEEAEVTLLAARAEMEKAAEEFREAESRLAASEAAATAGGWIERRGLKKWQEAVAALQERLSVTTREFEAKKIDVERLRDEVGALRGELSQPFAESARKRVIELGARVKQQQAALADTARELAALYQVVVERTPRRIVSQRVPDRFWRVHCPTMAGLYPDSEPPGVISIEPIRAMRGEREGKWTIVSGQDLSIRAEDIETSWGDSPLPPEVEAIRDRLDLGVAFSLNGEKKRELAFTDIAATVTPEDIDAAMKSISEGV